MIEEKIFEIVGRDEGEKIIDAMKAQIVSEIRHDLLPISVVMRDIFLVRSQNKKSAAILEKLLMAPLGITFDEIGKEVGLNREHVYRRLKRLSIALPWLNELLDLRSKYLRSKRPFTYHGEASGWVRMGSGGGSGQGAGEGAPSAGSFPHPSPSGCRAQLGKKIKIEKMQ